MSDDMKAAAERLLNEVTIHRADYTEGADLPDIVNDIETVARAALDAEHEAARLREALELLRQALKISAYGYHALSRHHGGALWQHCLGQSCVATQKDMARASALSEPGKPA